MPEGAGPADTLQPPHPPFGGPEMPPLDGPRGMRPGPGEFKLTPEAASLFDEGRTNGFYLAGVGVSMSGRRSQAGVI